MSPLDRELEKTFNRKAEAVSPPADLYAGVERRATRIRRRRNGAVAGAALSVLAVAIAVPLLAGGKKDEVGFVGPTPGVSESPEPVVTTAPPATTATTAPPTATAKVYVYFAADTGRRGFRLYRETHLAPAPTIASAVRIMLRGGASDADYRTLWPDDTKLLNVTVDGDLATVDLDGAARRTTVGSEAAELAVQQLVYTVTATDNSVKRVQILVDGKPARDLWGSVDASRPVARAPQNDVLAPVWIDRPAQNATVGRTFELGGTALVYEATVAWQVKVVRTGDVVAESFATAADASKRSPWSTTVTIPASVPDGTQLEVFAFETSAEDGSESAMDSKVVTLRG